VNLRADIYQSSETEGGGEEEGCVVNHTAFITGDGQKIHGSEGSQAVPPPFLVKVF
jgi:hypothetical protein